MKLNSRRVARYGAALLAVGAGTLVRALLTAWVGPGLPTYVTFYPVVMLVALLGGLGPGLLATVASAAVVDVWLVAPAGLGIARPVDAVGMGLFLSMGGFMSAVAAHLRHHRQKAADYQRELAVRESQEELRRQREWLRVTLTSIGDAVLVTDTAGRITFLNPVAESLTGWREQDAVGRPAAEVFRILNEQTRAAGEDLVGRVLREGHTLVLANHTVLVARDGREIPIEDSAAPIRDAAGKVAGAVLVFHDVTQKRHAQAQLQESEARLKRSQEIAHLGSWELNLLKNELSWSDEVYRIFGLRPQEFAATYEAFLQAIHPEDRAAVDAAYSGSVRDGKDSYEIEHRVVRQTGEVRWVQEKCAHVRDAAGRILRSVGMVLDITERKRAEADLRRANSELQQLNRTLQALKNSSQAMMRAISEEEYLRQVCSIVVQDCGHAMVWIGFAENDEARTVRPVASAGFEEGYLQGLQITWADTERGQGPTGTSIRTGEVCGCKDMLTDPAFAPWREQALKRGYASSLVLPLLNEGKAFGAIAIYSRQPDGFAEDEVRLLTQLAEDVSYGLSALRLRAAHAQAEAQLRLLSTAVEAAVNGVVISDRKGQIQWVNPAFSALTGYSREEVLGRNPRLLKSDRHPPEFYRQMWAVILRGEPWRGELVNRRKDGSLYTEEMTIAPVRASGAEITHFVAIKHDISQRKRAERRLDLLADTANRLLGTESPQQVVDTLCQRVLEVLDCQVFFNYLVDEPQQRLRLNACGGIPGEEARKIEWLDLGSAVCGCAARDGGRIVAENIQETPDPHTALVKSYGVQAYACHPLMVEGRVLGTLSFGARNRAHFSEDELSLMKAVADQVAVAVERKRAHDALKTVNEHLEKRVAERTTEVRENEARYRSLVTATSQIVWTTNTRGQVTGKLPTWEAFTGQTFAQYKGSGWSEAIHPDDRANALTVWTQIIAARSAGETEYRLRRHDGEYRLMFVRGVPVREHGSGVREWVGTCTDITERREAERRREFTNSLLSLFARNATSKDYLNSVVGIIQSWLGCQAIGIRIANDRQEIPYESWAGFEPEFLQLESRLSLQNDQCLCIRAISGACAEPDRSLLTRGGSFRADDALRFVKQLPTDKLGLYRGTCMRFGFASLAVIPIRYRSEVIGAIHLADRRAGHFPPASVEFVESMTPLIGEAVRRFQAEAELARYRDHLEVLVRQRTGELELANERLHSEIAERKQAQEALQHTTEDLERSNRDLEQFAYVASHDLQEPLRAVGGYVKLLQRRFSAQLDSKAIEFINGAVDGATRMERLITDLLAFSRVGTRGGDLVSTDLNAVLDNALHNLQTSISSAQAAVTHDPLPTLPVDATQIMQLFQNLIGNAIKFRGEVPPVIHIGARQEAERWVLSVRDNGIGIESQYFERIFQIFQRLHTRKYYPGTGIGLAICKRIVERHGGAIWVESKPGEGTTFYFSLPSALSVKSPIV